MVRSVEQGGLSEKGLIRLELKWLEKQILPQARFEVEKVRAKMTGRGSALTGMPTGKGIRRSPFEERMDELERCKRRVVELEEKRKALKRRLTEDAVA